MNGLTERVQVGGVVQLEGPSDEALFQEGENEYSLRDGATGCWITVASLSVSLRREEGRLVVLVFSTTGGRTGGDRSSGGGESDAVLR